MGHHAGQFRFVVGRLNSAHVDENRPARNGKRVNLFLLDNVKLVRP